jgi:elongation factor P hydroxylase
VYACAFWQVDVSIQTAQWLIAVASAYCFALYFIFMGI